ncbi:MAG TPA: NAD(P)-dependent oxidoreductase [Acidimicrobiales bacterium]|nr:NAD(P)-dependent oxidoreductase [Acidimicrobiales bacterium]
MSAPRVGVVGLGNMGSVLAANLVSAGFDVVTHDVAGSGASPAGATYLESVGDVARAAAVVVLSLPDGVACGEVARAVVDAEHRRAAFVVDTSTIGVGAAREIDALLSAGGLAYVDAPVSGGVAGARARTLLVMYAGAPSACVEVEPVLAGLSDRRRRVGDAPGMAQALKLANNFLSASALAATSEAVAFGAAVGLDMGLMLDVLNASSGRSQATADKFPNHVLTARYAAGFSNTLMAKDLHLYLAAVDAEDAPSVLAPVTAAAWDRFAATRPGADFTRIYPFVEGSGDLG